MHGEFCVVYYLDQPMNEIHIKNYGVKIYY
jgi:hypothetical protein